MNSPMSSLPQASSLWYFAAAGAATLQSGHHANAVVGRLLAIRGLLLWLMGDRWLEISVISIFFHKKSPEALAEIEAKGET